MTAKHLATGTSRATTTDESGTFLLAGLPPGVYGIVAEAQGFRPVSQAELRLGVGQTVEVTIPLSVVTLEETVNVSGTAVRVATATEGRLADSYSKAQIDELPLPQRDIFLITKMSAGATADSGRRQLDEALELACRHRQRQPLSRQQLRARWRDEHQSEQQRRTGDRPEPGVGRRSAGANGQLRLGVRPRQRRRHQHPDEIGNQFDEWPRVGIPPRCVADLEELLRHGKAAACSSTSSAPTLAAPSCRTGCSSSDRMKRRATTIGRPLAFQVETPEFRDYVTQTNPNSVAARLLTQFPSADAERGNERPEISRSAQSDDAFRHDSGDWARAGHD